MVERMSDLTADQVMSNLRPSTQNKLLKLAREFIASRSSFQVHPLRDTHANDVPVAMALFAQDRITELEAENARLKGVLREAVGVMKLWRKGDPLPIHVTDGWIDRIAKEWPDGL